MTDNTTPRQPAISVAPWTDEQVAAINYYQSSGMMHPFTCGNDPCRADLVATNGGWDCPRCHGWRQDWCYVAQTNWALRDAFNAALFERLDTVKRAAARTEVG